MRLLALIVTLMFSFNAGAALKTKTVEYDHKGKKMEGFLAWDSSAKGKRPGVLIVHEWKGIGDHVRDSAKKLAKMGYIAFAADIYGKDIRPKTNEEASKISSKYKSNRKLLRQRVNRGLDVLKKNRLSDNNNLAAIGYCFGGTTVLELARSGADIGGVVSFHGGLDSPNRDDGKNIKAKVLVLHGADDPYVKNDDIAAFQEEMRRGDVDWRMIYYGNAVHSFTNPAAGNDNSKGAAYNKRADRRSWEDMKLFFAELFG